MLLLENYFRPFGQRYGKNFKSPFKLHLFFKRSFSAPNDFSCYLIPGYGFLSSFFLPGNTPTSQLLLGTSSSGAGLVIHSTHWSTLWVHHPSYVGFNHPHKYFLKFPMAHLTTAESPTKLFLGISVVILLIFRWKNLVVDTFLLRTYKIDTFRRPFLVPLILLLPMRYLLEEVPLTLHPWTSVS